MDDRQQLMQEREELAEKALKECLEKGVSEDAIQTIAYEMGLTNLTEKEMT